METLARQPKSSAGVPKCEWSVTGWIVGRQGTRAALNGSAGSSPAPVAPAPAPAPAAATPAAQSGSVTFTSTPKRGSSGDEVKNLQVTPRTLDTSPADITPNGNFALSATPKAVQAFQKANGLSQVGVVVPSHRALLNK